MAFVDFVIAMFCSILSDCLAQGLVCLCKGTFEGVSCTKILATLLLLLGYIVVLVSNNYFMEMHTLITQPLLSLGTFR